MSTKAQRSAAAKKGWRTRNRNEAMQRAAAHSYMMGYPHTSDIEEGRIRTRKRKKATSRRRR